MGRGYITGIQLRRKRSRSKCITYIQEILTAKNGDKRKELEYAKTSIRIC